MSDDPYRDELQAAHQRIAALEAELTEIRAGGDLEDTRLDPHLLPGERVLWIGRPDARRKVLRPRHLAFFGGLLFFAFFLVVAMLRGMPPAFSVPAGSFVAFMAILTGYRGASALRDARATCYAVTDRRVLLLEPDDDEVSLRALPLEPGLGARLTLRQGGFGDLILEPRDRQQVTLPWLKDPATPHRLISRLAETPRALPEAGE